MLDKIDANVLDTFALALFFGPNLCWGLLCHWTAMYLTVFRLKPTQYSRLAQLRVYKSVDGPGDILAKSTVAIKLHQVITRILTGLHD